MTYNGNLPMLLRYGKQVLIKTLKAQEQKMSGRLNGKSAIITGASSGIGRASALLFAREGANLVLADVNETNLCLVRDEIANMGGAVIIRKTDVSSEDEIKTLISLALEKFTNIDILVNNAGISGGLDNLEDQHSEEWRQVYDVNVMGPVYATKHIIAHMKMRRKGSIINIASVAGI
ncbi:MAG TPA: SDR family NAD(P)-dependent oxidoreductase, partial [Bacteroidota bacterium]|nr:SDR family NAD(P)-dependent oxidoreductase [Bacteroidota bacterium]